jgi:hypothetical protein
MWMIELTTNTATAESRMGSQSDAMDTIGGLLVLRSFLP